MSPARRTVCDPGPDGHEDRESWNGRPNDIAHRCSRAMICAACRRLNYVGETWIEINYEVSYTTLSGHKSWYWEHPYDQVKDGEKEKEEEENQKEEEKRQKEQEEEKGQKEQEEEKKI
jgi:hypothetical protein